MRKLNIIATVFVLILICSIFPYYTVAKEADIPVPPTADFTWTPTYPLPGDTVLFTSTSSDDGTILSTEWDFGDGHQASGPSATHVFQWTGSFYVEISVTDDDGLTATKTYEIEVGSHGDLSVEKNHLDMCITIELRRDGSPINYDCPCCYNTVYNIEQNPESMLDWGMEYFEKHDDPTINLYFSPRNGDDLRHGDETTVEIAPSLRNWNEEEYVVTGSLKYYNIKEESDFEIVSYEITIETVTTKTKMNIFLERVLERFPRLFPMITQILQF